MRLAVFGVFYGCWGEGAVREQREVRVLGKVRGTGGRVGAAGVVGRTDNKWDRYVALSQSLSLV